MDKVKESNLPITVGGSVTEYVQKRAARISAAFFWAMMVFLVSGSVLIGLSGLFEKKPEIPQGDDDLAAVEVRSASDVDEAIPVIKEYQNDGCLVVDGGKSTPDTASDGQSKRPTSGRTHYVLAMSDGQQDVVYELAQKYDVPADLVFGVISADSVTDDRGGRPSEEDPVMNVNPVNAAWCEEQLGFDEPMGFYENLECGVMILGEYYHKYSDIIKIAMCYELGEEEALKRWGSGEYETEYSRLVVRETATLTERAG